MNSLQVTKLGRGNRFRRPRLGNATTCPGPVSGVQAEH